MLKLESCMQLCGRAWGVGNNRVKLENVGCRVLFSLGDPHPFSDFKVVLRVRVRFGVGGRARGRRRGGVDLAFG